jgi:hypothetical protein
MYLQHRRGDPSRFLFVLYTESIPPKGCRAGLPSDAINAMEDSPPVVIIVATVSTSGKGFGGGTTLPLHVFLLESPGSFVRPVLRDKVRAFCFEAQDKSCIYSIALSSPCHMDLRQRKYVAQVAEDFFLTFFKLVNVGFIENGQLMGYVLLATRGLAPHSCRSDPR